MMRKAKTNKNLITILSGIVVAVFASIVMLTYCAFGFLNTYTSGRQPGLYAANQQLKVVNDTLVNPIRYGVSSQGYNISIQYAIDYDFDLKLSYSLSWSNGANTDNVILTFANRDDYIVDDYVYGQDKDSYIYKASKITAGSGLLNIITGVSFVKYDDSTYQGATLTINVRAEMYKADKLTYNENHPLYEVGSMASEKWKDYRSNNITNPYAIVYNYAYDYAHGAVYPNDYGTYVKNINASEQVTSYDWLGGNRSYAGVGLFIFTGTSDVYLTARVAGIWRQPQEASQTDGNIDLAFENNIKYNYADNWDHSFWDASTKLYETRTFRYKLEAGKTFYIPVVESIEITSVKLKDADYSNYRAVTNVIQINGSSFIGRLSHGEISNGEVVSTISAYTPSKVSIVNISKYNNNYINNTEVNKLFETSVTYINNTNQDITITANYGLSYRVSNGLDGFDTDDDLGTITRPEELGYTDLELFRDITGKGVNYTITGNATSYLAKNGAVEYKNTLDANNKNIVLPAYSSITKLTAYQVDADIIDSVSKVLLGLDENDTNNKRYDLWLEVNPSWSLADNNPTKANVSLEIKENDGKIELYAKNNTNKKLTSVNVGYNVYTYEYDFISFRNKPADWDYAYWSYYNSMNINDPVVVKNVNWDTTPKPTFYAMSTISVSLMKGNQSDLTLLPNEIKLIASYTGEIDNEIYVQLTSLTNTENVPNGVELINAGNANSMIVNFSDTNSYYVRFDGTLTSAQDNITTAEGYNYYIGILRPHQVLSIPTSTAMTLDAIVYNAGESYTTTLSSWQYSVYDEYFR